MNTAFKKVKNFFRTVTAVLTAAVMGLSTAVFADNGEKAALSAKGDMAEVILTLSRAASEKVSSLQISLNVKANTDNAEITFIPNEKLGAKIQESRYHKDTGELNIYTVGTSPLFDKENPTVSLGYVKISTNEVNGAAANVAFVKGSLKFVRGSLLVTYDNDLSYSESVKITVGNGGAAEPPMITDKPVVTEDNPAEPPIATEPPVVTAEPPVVIPPNNGEISQPAELSALSAAVAAAESYKAADYTEDSFKVLQQAIAQAKEILNSSSPSLDQIEEARMLLENAIGMLTKKTDQPASDVTTGQSQSPGETDKAEEGTGKEEGSSPESSDGVSPSVTDGNNDSENDGGGIRPLVIILIAVAVVVAGLTAGIVIMLNKRKNKGGRHSK